MIWPSRSGSDKKRTRRFTQIWDDQGSNETPIISPVNRHPCGACTNWLLAARSSMQQPCNCKDFGISPRCNLLHRLHHHCCFFSGIGQGGRLSLSEIWDYLYNKSWKDLTFAMLVMFLSGLWESVFCWFGQVLQKQSFQDDVAFMIHDLLQKKYNNNPPFDSIRVYRLVWCPAGQQQEVDSNGSRRETQFLDPWRSMNSGWNRQRSWRVVCQVWYKTCAVVKC